MRLQHGRHMTRKMITYLSHFRMTLQDIQKMTLDLYITTIYRDLYITTMYGDFINFLENEEFE